MTTFLYPYHVFNEGIKLNLGVDGQSVNGLRHELEQKAGTIKINVKAELPGKLDAAFCSAEKNNLPLYVGLEVLNISQQYRKIMPMKRQAPAVYTHGFTVRDDEKTGEMKLSAVVLRKKDARRKESFKASLKGARVAWSPEYSLIFDKKKTKGTSIEASWEDFSTHFTDEKKYFLNALYYLDTSGADPRLLLNENIGARGKRFIHDVLVGTAEQHAVLGLIAAAATSELLRRAVNEWWELWNDDTTPAGLADDRWEQGIIRDWAARLYPEEPDKEAARDKICREVIKEKGRKRILEDLVPLASQNNQELIDKLKKLAIGQGA